MSEQVLPTSCDVVVIGAGLAGLTAARALTIAGRSVAVLDSSDDIGGRVRTDNVDGLLLDRGFQLYNPSYPEGAHILDLKALDLQPLTAGVIVSIDGRNYRMGNPKHEPTWAVDSLLAPVGPLKAKMGFAKYAAGIALGTEKSDAIDQRTEAFLNFKFGREITSKLLRPFLAGVFLEEELATSKRFLDIVLRSFVHGTPSVPRYGMQEIPRQLAAQLRPNTIFCNVAVTAISPRKVTTAQGVIKCSAIIVATDANTAEKLVPAIKAPTMNSVTTWYHLADCAPEELTKGKGTLVVDGKRYAGHQPDPARPVVNTVALSNAAPSYASDGRVLVSSSAVGLHRTFEAEKAIRSHLANLYAVSTSNWECVAAYPIANALPAMLPPHVVKQTARIVDGLYVAGDYRAVSSINGAFASGRRAAEALLIDGL